MAPRITISISANDEFEGLSQRRGTRPPVKKLQALSERNDHFHLGPDESWEIQISTRAYQADEKIIQYGKVLFRTDEWDRKYFPHVLGYAN